MKATSLAGLLFFATLSWVQAQGSEASSDTLRQQLPVIEVEAIRSDLTENTATLALSVQTRSPEQMSIEAPASLTETLRTLPGVWFNNRENAALGERLSIRGMGWRSAFGVRGVMVLFNGIPLTMPDGQTILDIVEPAFIHRAELIRGPASMLWGNASGGVLSLSTEHRTVPTAERTLAMFHLRALTGSYGRRHILGTGQMQWGRQQMGLSVSHLRLAGYREHSRTERTRAILTSRRTWSQGTLHFTAAFIDVPISQHPGARNAEDALQNPRGADPRFVNTRSGKASQQGQAGLTLNTKTHWGRLSATTYGLFRTLENPLPFAYIRLNRRAGGIRLSLHAPQTSTPFQPKFFRHWMFGLDANGQNDQRKNWNNDQGQPGENLRLDQTETVTNVAGFGQLRSRWGRTQVHAGLRYDYLRFGVNDLLLSNGDQSGNRIFGAFNYHAGLTFNLNSILFFLNTRTAFESPTTTELVNRPDLVGGFNADLDPQRTIGFEAGLRGRTRPLYFEITAFHMKVKNRLVPFQTEAGGNRTFYRNRGETLHTGLEAAVTWPIHPTLTIQWTYALGRYRFSTDDEVDGNRLPGLPAHRLFGSLRWHHRDVWARVQMEAVSRYDVDDNNTAENAGYVTVDLYLGHTNIMLSDGLVLQPFLNITNLTNTRYNGSVLINARGGRYYEPAADRAFLVGLNVHWQK